MTTEEKPLHIIELRATNVKRIRAVRIRPNGNTVLISGENAQGKSSILDAIEMALRGKKAMPLEPVRHGARESDTFLDLGAFTVERTTTSKGTELVVKDKHGVKQSSPQTLLDKLCAAVAFDPLEFARMESKKQDETLKKMLGLDFSDIDAAKNKVEEERANANREVKRLQVLLAEREPWHGDAPKQLVDVAALSTKVQAHASSVSKREVAQAKSQAARETAERASRQIDTKRKELEVEIARRQAEISALETECAQLTKTADELQTAVPAEPASIATIEAELKNAEATNAKVRANEERTKLEEQLQKKTEEVEDAKATLESLEEDRQSRLAEAKFPIDGLGFDDSGPTFKNAQGQPVPLAQASQAERLRVSVAIGAALNPRVRVMLIREGAFLDKAGVELLAQLARETDSQIWIERVEDNNPACIVIQDGSIVENKAAAEAQRNGGA